MSCHCVQASVSQRLASGARSRRRFVPLSPSVAVSQSVNQRWRERPRCPARRLTPGHRDGVVHAIVDRAARRRFRAVNVQDERAARAHVLGATFAGRMRLANRTEISSGASSVFPPEASRLQTQIQASHHRVLDAGAVLGIVNALRSASTRPSAGPAGIDDASARHVQQLRDGRQPVDHSKMVDAGIAQAYVDIITSVPHGTPSVRRHGLWSAHSAGAPGHGIERNSQKIAD